MGKLSKKSLALLIAGIFALTAIFSFLFIVSETDHHCVGENCQVCHLVRLAEQTLEQIGSGNTYFYPAVAVFFIVVVLAVFTPLCTQSTLVGYKVRLNN